ncbi:hypothetical protein PIIN_08666 [Serendipita indica DSM 11827]|uniref:Uncharacterized protein n=1 Tax=Serendipita indica (strain DSM 11827) TaxID=1109443 RepID=G4TTR3_SERID|nr:hypothetical protein PIIN_08666 [Serendipita indica DSM 11827]
MSSQPRPQEPSQSFSTNRPNTFTKLDLKPRRYHFYNVLLFIFGTFFPPLAVAARFGIGQDFWLNLLLTICGYIPGHGHNFYIQNIRNNKNHRRTPKWARRYGLVDDSEIRRKEARSQWAGRYNDRLPQSTLEGREVEEGQIPDREPEQGSSTNVNGTREERLWDSHRDESFYGQRRTGSGSVSTGSGGRAGRWHYPANFEDTEVEQPASGKKKRGGLLGGKKKKDRWELSEDARRGARVPDGEYVGEPPKKKKKTKRRKKGGDGVGNDDDVSRTTSISRSDIEEPEDPVGGLYGNRDQRTSAPEDATTRKERADRELFEHQF